MMFQGHPLRSRLALTTALAGGLLLPAAALAQTTNGVLPNAGDATFTPGVVTISGGGPTAGSTLDISVNRPTAVIDWFHFDVPATDTVNFANNAGVPVAAVLNRVRAGGSAIAAPSIIDGKINAPGVEVWLQNPEGIMFGSGVAINAAGFVATAAEVNPADFGDGDGNFRFLADANSVARIGGGGAGASFVTNGGKLAFIAPAVAVQGSFDAGTGSAAFVTATDVTMTANPGSPLGLTVNRGTSVGTDAQVVGGTVNGGEAYFVLATRDTVVDALLNVTAGVTASGAVANGRGVTLVAGNGPTTAPGVTIAGSAADVGGAVRLSHSGAITASGAGQQVYARSSGTITGTGAIVADNNVSVETLRAIALDDVTSTNGAVDIYGGSIAADDVVAGSTATFGVSAGAIALGSVLATGDITLVSATADPIGVARATRSTGGGLDIEGNGAVTLGPVTTAQDVAIGLISPPSSLTITGATDASFLDLHTSGALKTGTLTARTGPIGATAGTMEIASGTATNGPITFTATGAIKTDALTAGAGNLVVTGGSLGGITAPGTNLAAPKGAIGVTTTGTAILGTVTASGAISARGSAVTTGNVTGGGTLSLTSAGGPLRIEGDALAAGDATLSSAGAVALSSVTSSGGAIAVSAMGAISGLPGGNGDLTANGAVTVSSSDAITLDALRGSVVDVTGRSAAIGSATATAGDIRVRATGGAASLGATSASNDVILTATGAATLSGAVNAGRDYTVVAGSVVLGGATQQAQRRIELIANSGSITGATGLALIGDAAGAGITRGVILDAANGALTLGGSRILGGNARSTDVALRFGAGSPLVLGDVSASALGVTDALRSGSAPMAHNAAITLGNVEITNALSVSTSGGGLTAGQVRTSGAGAGVSLIATGNGGNVSVDSVDATGAATVRGSGSVQVNRVAAAGGDVNVSAGTTLGGRSGGRADLTATAGDVIASAGGAATLGGVTGRSVLVNAGSIDATAVTATTGTLGLTATAGGITVGTLNSANALSLTSSANLSIGTLDVAGGSAALTSTNGTVSIADNATVGGDLRVAGQAVTLGLDVGSETIAAVGTIDITARTGAIVGGDGLTLRSDSSGVGNRNLILDAATGGIAFLSNSVLQAGPAQQSNIGLRLGAGGGDIVLGSLSANRIAQVDAAHATFAPISIAGRFTVGAIASRQAFDVSAGGSISVGNVQVSDAGGAIRLVSNGDISTLTLTSPGEINVASGGGVVTVGNTTSNAAGVTIRGTAVTSGIATAATALDVRSTSGALTLAGGSAGTTATLNSAGALTVTNTVTGTTGATANATGAANIGAIRSANGAVTVDAASNTIGTATAGTALSVNARSGASSVGTASAGSTARVTSTGDTTLTTGVTSGGATTITGANVRLASAAASAGGIDITATGEVTGISGGRANLSAGGAGNDVRVTAGTASGAVLLGTVTAADEIALRGTSVDATTATATSGALSITATTGNVVLGTGTAGGAATVTASGGTVNATRVVAGTTLGVTSGGALTLGSAQAGGAATLDAGGAATLGAVTAGPTLSIRATDATITGAQTATRVTVANRAPTATLRLGDSTGADGFRLSAAEIGLIATDALTLDGGTGAIEIGTLAFGTTNGRNTVDVLTTGRIDIRGAVSGAGAGRVFRFGGTANATDRASTIQIATTANAGGRLLFGTADLELRGTRIAQGQSAGFLDALGSLAPADVVARFINNPGSSLYNATIGGTAYDPANSTILTANRVTVRYADYALFQNTGQIGENLGIVVNTVTGSTPSLNLLGSGDTGGIGGVALYGTVNGIGGVATALLGPPDVAASNVNLRAGRINGCLINSGAGCLTNVVAQPVLNVFDASRTQILRAAENLAVPFDPVVGTNNEALFSGVSSIDTPVDETPQPARQCPDGSTSPNCPPKQENNQ